MKRGLVFTLCALALAASASSAMAQSTVDLSLNLRYTDPANPAEGGTWYLMAKTNDDLGLSGVSAYLRNINVAGVVRGNATANAQYAAMATTVTGSITSDAGTNAATVSDAPDPDVVNLFWGFDLATAITGGVGKGSGAGNIATDPLKNPAWNNAALLLSGTFGATRPVFVDDVGTSNNDTGANTLSTTTPGGASEGELATVTKVVRGDSLASLGLNSNPAAGLRPADSNRDFAVNGLDLAILAANFNGTGKNWDTGDSNNDGNVNGLDLASLAANFNQTSPAPVAAIPEPASIGLLALAFGGILASRRRS